MADERTALKDWFNAALVDDMATRLLSAEPAFDAAGFRQAAKKGLLDLEMLDRVRHLADAVRAALPGPTSRALSAIVATLPPAAESGDGITGHGHAHWVYGEVIGRHGLDDVDASFAAMIELTQRFSAEFAVRPFLAQDLDGSLRRLEALVDHPSLHVRRWVSEGTRTRLPWGKKVPGLEQAAARRLALLARLRHDEDRYVQRSVANHLQDALKDDVDVAFPVLSAWVQERTPSTTWIATHAARGLLKAGHPETMRLFGLDARVDVETFKVSPKRVAIGDEVTLTATVRAAGAPSRASQTVRLDYVLRSPGKKPGTTNTKVFRFADVAVSSTATSTTVSMRHAFVHRSIRTVHAGRHELILRANGVDVASATVTVTAP